MGCLGVTLLKISSKFRVGGCDGADDRCWLDEAEIADFLDLSSASESLSSSLDEAAADESLEFTMSTSLSSFSLTPLLLLILLALADELLRCELWWWWW